MFSEFARFTLVDAEGRHARLVDAAIDAAAGDYPPVRGLIFRYPARRQSVLDWEAVRSVDWRRRRIVVGDLTAGYS